LLDLFCGAGGAAMGYYRAGFDVVGVDIVPQPDYPFEFHHMDALALRRDRIAGCWHESPVHSAIPGMSPVCLGCFAAVHASPPCQAYSDLRVMPNAKDGHPDLVGPTRGLLVASGLPYVIENVVGAPLLAPLLLCGAAFGLGWQEYQLARHRLFEVSFPCLTSGCACDGGRTLGLYGDHARTDRRSLRIGAGQLSRPQSLVAGRVAMAMPWAGWRGITQAIPPAYTEHIGGYLMAELAARAAA
jgi:DNA (cytosine-5)-methyltransferase 1